MNVLIKTCIAAVFCLLSAVVYATKHDSIKLAESIVSQTQFDYFVTDVTFDMLFSHINFDDQAELDELKKSLREIYGNDIKKQISIKLLEIYNEQELESIKYIFADKRIRNTFFVYYKMWISPEKSHHFILPKNIGLFLSALESKQNHKPKYIQHKHYGKKLSNDPILNMLKLMDGLKGENAVIAYQPWAREQKEKEIKILTEAYPVLAGHEKELSKLYDTSVDVFINYWTLREDTLLRMEDFQATVNAMEKNEAFRQFFIEIYNILEQISASIEKDFKFKKWLDKKYKNKEGQDKIST